MADLPGKQLNVGAVNKDNHNEFRDRYLNKVKNLIPDGERKKNPVRRLTSLEFHRHLAGVKNDEQLASGHHGWNLGDQWKGYSAVAKQAVSEDAFRVLAESIFESRPYSKRYVELKPLGGAIARVDKSESAFWHRDPIWWLLSSHFLPKGHTETEADDIRSASRSQHDRFIKEMGDSFSGLYSGYIDQSNALGQDPKSYYGDHAQQLLDIKKTRDPENLFRLYLPESPPDNITPRSSVVAAAAAAAVQQPGPRWLVVNDDADITARHEACFVMVDRKAYLIGGHRHGRKVNRVDIYDPVERTWSKGASPPLELHHSQCVAADNKVWIVSSWTGKFPKERNTDSIYIYDPASDSWSTKAGLPEPRRRGAAASVLVGRRIYVSHGNRGGHFAESNLNATSFGWLDYYDIDEDRWTTNLPDAPNPRDHAGGALVDGKICVAGGRLVGEPDFFDKVVLPTDCFNLSTESWEVHDNIPQGRGGSFYGTTCDGKLMVAGGEGFGKAWKNVDVFDGSKWTSLGNLNAARHGAGLAVDCKCNQIHIASGCRNQGGKPELTSLETLFPSGVDEACAA